MSASFELKGIDELKAKLYSLEKAVGRRILAKGLRAGDKLITDEAKRTAPVGETGRFRKSIKLRAGKRSSVTMTYQMILSNKDVPATISKAGKRSWYPAAIEFGSHFHSGPRKGQWKIKPRATMRTAFEAKKQQALDTILNTFWSELESVAAAH